MGSASEASPAQRAIIVLTLLVGVVAVYWVPGLTEGARLRGADVPTLHERRIRYAQESLFGPRHELPAWFSREQFGTPFWANVQNFPWIPTRLPLLLLKPTDAFTASTFIAALLSATCMYLYARRMGMTAIGAAASGWTFTACGYFASRVRAGQMAMLEAYAGLPLLLWLIERVIASDKSDAQAHDATTPRTAPRRRWNLLWIGLVSLSLSLAGHPQLPVYILIAACGYAIVRAPNRTGLRVVASVFCGGLTAGIVAWPMLLLVTRSSRMLALNPATSHIPLAYGRLRAIFFPMIDGVPLANGDTGQGNFSGYPNAAYFWDSVSYLGWMPWIALLIVIAALVLRKTSASRATLAITAMGIAGIVLALPFWQQALDHIPGTFLRSPARLLYLFSFAMSLALGAGLHLLGTLAPRRATWPVIVTGLALVIHFVDVTAHARTFVMPAQKQPSFTPSDERLLRHLVGDARSGFDWTIIATMNRTVDDAGFYDSISLANTYAHLMKRSKQLPGTNVEEFNAVDLPLAELRALGIRLVVSNKQRFDLNQLDVDAPVHVYSIPDARPRAFIEQGRGDATYRRVSSDIIEVKTRTDAARLLVVLEAFDPGWRATVDGASVPVELAEGMFMQVPLAAGTHDVRLTYHTPGVGVGTAISGVGVLGLSLMTFARPRPRATP